jgi:branched-subunit amino acid transport protein
LFFVAVTCNKVAAFSLYLRQKRRESLDMYFTGIIIGVATFFIIGLFHPIVIKGEYYFGTKCWWVFLVAGIVATATSLIVADVLWSTLLAVVGASSFWSIKELFEQRERVRKGWFPKNPKREE